jgi:adenylylsulfate reductase subunit A
MDVKKIFTDILIIGGGAAGCQAAIRAKEIDKNLDVLIVEKANIIRSGCLAAGVNAINAYLNKGETPESYVEYVKKESSGLIREDLTYTIGKRLNKMAKKLEEYGLPIQKDENGRYVARGKRSIKINGESIKPILAEATLKAGVKVLNNTIATNYILKDETVCGAYAFSIKENKFYVIMAKAVICTTGGASGIYKPNNPGAARHKMWYSPFNTGAGFAMGLRAGAEMTTFEMRFIALRVKDVISPTGTIAQGVKVSQINALGEKYMEKYENNTTPMRLYATLIENLEGRGPCYLDTRGISDEDVQKLKEAYLSMSPGIILKWKDEKINPKNTPIEICGSEPYIVGGHGQAGYWVDINRKTTLEGLYAAGDVVGGSPKKYVTGCMAEGEIAVEAAIEYIKSMENDIEIDEQEIAKEIDRVFYPLNNKKGEFSPDEIEERMQKVMDEYAGGISSYYRVNESKLLIARELLKAIEEDLSKIKVRNRYELMKYHEVVDRILVARAVVEHLLYRKETRWKCYQERVDYPEIDDNWFKFINSKYNSQTNDIEIIEREYEKFNPVINNDH